ncbi:MAG: permease [Actinomycetota bacterium]|nr:permease [Actinomycetota bacterium]
MSTTAIVINSLVGIALLASVFKDRGKTWTALKVTWNASKRLTPAVLAVILAIGLFLGFIPPDWIARTLGNQGGFIGVAIAAFLGSVLFIPAVLAFPLGASLLESGAGIMSVAAFITTLTMVGFVFIPIEIKELGKRFTLLRNGLSFVAAIIIAVLMGLIL